MTTVVEGDLLTQQTDCIVNSWNRNMIPRWLLIPHGVSGAIKKAAGKEPFIELSHKGPLALGQAVSTSAGKLPFRCIIHVAAINLMAQSNETAIRDCVISAMKLASELGMKSIAFPVLGTGSGRFSQQRAETIMLETLQTLNYPVEATLVRYRKL